MRKLEKLTDEQIALMNETRDNWLDFIFSSRKPIDRKLANEKINWLYETSNLDKPKAIIWISSPLGVQYAANMLSGAKVRDQVRAKVGAQVRAKVGAKVGAQVRAQVWAKVRDQVWDQVWDQVGAKVWAKVRDQVWDQVWDQVGAKVRDQVRDQIGAQVRDQVGAKVGAKVRAQVRAKVGAKVRDQVGAKVWAKVRAQVWDQVGAKVRDQVWDQVRDQVGDQELKYFDFTRYGSIWDYGWVSFFDFFQKIGLVNHKGFIEFKTLLESGIYDMVLLKDFCIVCELPTIIERSGTERLHNEKSAAIEWHDGYKLWFWKGTSVPKKLIETPELITEEDLKNNENAEVRRCFIEKLGVSKYFEILSDGQVLDILDEDIDNQGYPMKLMSFDFEGETIQVLECTCPSTERVYNIYPPSQNCKNVWDAKADTFNKEKLAYRHGDVGLLSLDQNHEKPLIET